MKLKLIFPETKCGLGNMWYQVNPFWRSYATAPLSVLTIAALTPKDVEVSIADENLNSIDFEEKVDLVGISFIIIAAKRAYEIADEFRARGVKVILGGVHVSVLPEEALLHADAVVIGEAEGVWAGVIRDFRENKLQRIYRCVRPPDLKNSLIPAWNLVNANAYNYFSIQFSRGCPVGCDYCSVAHVFGTQVRYKPVENVVKEIEFIRSIDKNKLIFFSDDNIISNPEYAKRIFRAIIPLKVRWFSQAPIAVARDQELLDLMRASGCCHLAIGFESVSQSSLDALGKGVVNKVADYAAAVEKIHASKIPIFGLFVLGGDYDDESTFDETFRFIDGNNLPFAGFHILTPVPGTRLFERLEKENRLLHKHWDRYTADETVFLPKKLSPQTLEKAFKQLWQKVYTYESIYKRLSESWNKGLLVSRRQDYLHRLGVLMLAIPALLVYRRFADLLFLLKSIIKSRKLSVISIFLNLNLRNYVVSKFSKNV